MDYVKDMTDLYDQRIDAMKARERSGKIYWETASLYGQMTMTEIVGMKWSGRRYEEAKRNIERLAAYKRKRAEYV